MKIIVITDISICNEAFHFNLLRRKEINGENYCAKQLNIFGQNEFMFSERFFKK